MAGIEKLALSARGPAPQGSLKFAPPGPPAGMSHPTKSGDFVGAPARGAKPATRSLEVSAWLPDSRKPCPVDRGACILEPRSRARTMLTLLLGGRAWSWPPFWSLLP